MASSVVLVSTALHSGRTLRYVDRIKRMCLTLYLATRDEQPLVTTKAISVEAVRPRAEGVRQWFSLPIVRFIGADTGCSCGFRHVIAEKPLEYWQGVFDADERQSMQALVRLIREHVAASGEVELYPAWNDKVDAAPKGTINLPIDKIDPQTFFFVERFFYRVHGGEHCAGGGLA
jgi:hypothetical protein